MNWGCRCDLRWLLNLGRSARVFVVDSHRPIHLHNLNDQNKSMVVLYTSDDEQELANASELNSDDERGRTLTVKMKDDESSRKRMRVYNEDETDPVQLFKKIKREYYRTGTFLMMPSRCLMYDLSHLLGKNTNELFRLTRVSLTDQFVHDRLTNESC
uniref:Uncharacterized protein n=1 Tax=Salix viminalis TaxID=40686 RepID=A0A6N2NBE8_SALVM